MTKDEIYTAWVSFLTRQCHTLSAWCFGHLYHCLEEHEAELTDSETGELRPWPFLRAIVSGEVKVRGIGSLRRAEINDLLKRKEVDEWGVTSESGEH